MKGFQHSFALDPNSHAFSNLQGNIVSVLQGGCFFGAAASFWLSDVLYVLTGSYINHTHEIEVN
jgi:MFS transporter, SP family, sugar:H+ symporter